MRKQLAIGLSLLLLTALGGEWRNFSHESRSSASQKIHNSEISFQSIDLQLPNRFSFQTASVSFITGGDALTFPEFPDISPEQCKNLGFSLTTCTSGNPSGTCPYNSAYFKECCDARYKYDKSACTYPNTVSGDSCGGKFMCYCDRSLYPETKCASPMVAESGGSCVEDGVTYYSKCVCPTYYSQTCDGQNLQGSGEGCTQDGVTKYTSCECTSGYNMTCSDLGPVTPTDYCLKDGVKYYNNCKTCENKCTLAECPEGILCEYEECSQKYCDIGCAVGYTNWCTPPETDCATLGYTKTADVCDGEDVIKCPYDTAAVFCKGAIKCQAGAVLASDKKCYDAANLPSSVKAIAVVFDVENQLAVALTDVKEDGSAGSVTMYWTTDVCDNSGLENCTDEFDIKKTCGIDGRTNTNKILVSYAECGGKSHTANAVNTYQTSSCSADFCQKGKWFLPSMKELWAIYSNKSVINNSLSLLTNQGASNLQEYYYWSSTYSSTRFWYFGMSNGQSYNPAVSYGGKYVRPVIYYGEEKAVQTKVCDTVGDILYGDGTCAVSTSNLEPSLTPIGVVFDVENQLALALTDVKEDGSAGGKDMTWSSNYCNTPNLENCTDSSTITISCGLDGRKNTDAILASTCNGTTYAANAVNSYQISGCSKDFCKQGKWFLPSVRDLNTIYSFKSTVNNRLSLLASKGASQLQESYYYWSSTEYNDFYAWSFLMVNGLKGYYKKSSLLYYVRPVLAF